MPVAPSGAFAIGSRVSVIVGVGGMGVKVEIGTAVSVGMPIVADAHEAKIDEITKTITIFLIFIDYLISQGTAQRFALPALGRGRRSRPARKKLRRRKLLEIAAESPASGARFVGLLLFGKTL